MNRIILLALLVSFVGAQYSKGRGWKRCAALLAGSACALNLNPHSVGIRNRASVSAVSKCDIDPNECINLNPDDEGSERLTFGFLDHPPTILPDGLTRADYVAYKAFLDQGLSSGAAFVKVWERKFNNPHLPEDFLAQVIPLLRVTRRMYGIERETWEKDYRFFDDPALFEDELKGTRWEFDRAAITKGDMRVVVLVDREANEVAICVPGTSGSRNLQYGLDWFPEYTFSENLRGNNARLGTMDGKRYTLHEGFLEASMALRPVIKEVITKLLSSMVIERIRLFGHSLGGAAVSILVPWLNNLLKQLAERRFRPPRWLPLQQGSDTIPKLVLYTIGTAPVSNPKFPLADTESATHILIFDDIVPSASILGFGPKPQFLLPDGDVVRLPPNRWLGSHHLDQPYEDSLVAYITLLQKDKEARGESESVDQLDYWGIDPNLNRDW